MKKGGKRKVEVTHGTKISPSYILVSKMWDFLIIATLVPWYVTWSLLFSLTPFHHDFT